MLGTQSSSSHDSCVCMCVCVGCRWVFISGMPGFGKTVLAAEAVRDANLLEEVFPGKSF